MVIGYPENQGLYDSRYEHDACGIGFIAHIKGQQSNEIVRRGLEALERMAHRGAEGADKTTGDGAGIMIQVPEYYRELILALPPTGQYGTGLVFLPQDAGQAEYCQQVVEQVLRQEGLELIAWREVPVDSRAIGEIAAQAEPVIRQVFVQQQRQQNHQQQWDQQQLERKLYVVRKLVENHMRASELTQAPMFYFPSLSTKTVVYKGMFMSSQLKNYYGDLQDSRLRSAIAMVHSRFSTNTFPSWKLAHPYRLIAHNGEINTIKGNRFWIEARESNFVSELFGDDIEKLLPILEPGASDSASIDNVLELLTLAGRSLPHAVSMLIPESFNKLNPIPEDLKYFYEYHAAIMEPWDGPAAIIFCDGRYVGGTLDRNGLRPARYVVSTDDLIVMASEVGVQTFPPEQVAYKGRLRPGKLLLVDVQEGRIIPDEEIKAAISGQQPYREWVEDNRVQFANIQLNRWVSVALPDDELHTTQLLFGYNNEDIDQIIIPMIDETKEPVSSMGTDTPIAVFSDRPQRLFNYFKQVFAQVTNPAIDSIREQLVMTLTAYIGKEGNLLGETPEHCRTMRITRPVFTNVDLEKIREWEASGNDIHFPSVTLPMTFPVAEGPAGLKPALDRLVRAAEQMVDQGRSFIILSDRDADQDNVPIPSLLACAAVHHHLIRAKKRNDTALIIETGEAREVMHFALLFGYGASAVNPYAAFATIYQLFLDDRLPSVSHYYEAEEHYLKALDKALLKVLSKLGISTLRSYHGAQTFEAIGLGKAVIDEYFPGTDSRIGGIGLEEIAREALMQHHKAFVERPPLLESEGVYSYRVNGEKHAWNPEAIHLLQWACRTNDERKYREFARLVNSQNQRPHVLRGLLDFKPGTPIPIEEVEPASEIFKRLTTGAMSFGSLGKEVHETLAIAMNSLGARSNSGEGGEEPERFVPRPDGSWTRSAIKQVASGRFGVTSNYLVNADELQIKIAQGAKPGEGGQLPGHKVDEHIAKTRHSTPGVQLISPPPHHDIYSIEDLKQLIFDLKNANPEARVSVKLVSEAGVGTIAAGVAKAHADTIVISGYDGGTGASPLSSIKHAGLPFELGLAETHQTLLLNNLRGWVRLQTDGQLKTGRDVVLAAMLGAEQFAFGTGALISVGCVMMRKCHQNTCPVGIATQDPRLRKRFQGKPEHLINYLTFMVQEIREIMAGLGIRTFDELVGRTDLLTVREVDHWKARHVDLSAILYQPEEAAHNSMHYIPREVQKTEEILDLALLEQVGSALDDQKPVSVEMPITNASRAVGATLSYHVSKRYGEEGLPDDTICVTFKGSAGQSFGAFLAKGLTFWLQGDANDYFGKGLSGGKLIVTPPEGSTFKPEENIIIGNTVLYGATGGEAYIRGIAGERFAVRNSGAHAVIEGTGDHGAEYMTGGRIVVLGRVGRNFAAGMSGGIAYVLNVDGDFAYFCNQSMVELSPAFDQDDQRTIRALVSNHLRYTGSAVAQRVLDNWHVYLPRFIKVMPLDYKRVLEAQQEGQAQQQYRLEVMRAQQSSKVAAYVE
jgi:glutamate synthase (NADPH/NADH) large chain